MDVICIDGKFPPAQLFFYDRHGVTIPQEGKHYTIREVIHNTRGGTGLLLNELVNPKVPIAHSILGEALVEPNWNIHRFAHLNGDPLTEAEALEVQESLQKVG